MGSLTGSVAGSLKETVELNDFIVLDRLNEIAVYQGHDKDECPNMKMVSPMRFNKAYLVIRTKEHNRRVAMSEMAVISMYGCNKQIEKMPEL